MGTIQLDAIMPQRFGLTYMGADNREHTPYVIHRALLGSLERFIGILIEHYGGAFPFWLAPVQVRVLPVGEAHFEPAKAIAERLRAAGYRVEIDEPAETIGKRIRAAELEKIPFTIVFGDRESERSPGDSGARRRAERGIACGFPREACYACLLKSRSGPVPHLPGLHALARGSTESKF